MVMFHTALLYLHIALGALALVIYWVPILSTKGSRLHRQIGKLFYYLMLFVAASGMLMSSISLYDPLSIYANGRQLTNEQISNFLVWRIPFSQFLLLLSLLTWVTVRHAIGVLRAGANRQMLRGIAYQGPVFMLLPLALFVFYQGYRIGIPLLMIFAVVSLVTVFTVSSYVYKTEVSPRAWIIEHFSAMVGSGIAVYTAFFAAGGRRLVAQWLPDNWQLITWLAAPVIGSLTLISLTGYYKRRYKVNNNKALQQD